MTAIQRVRVSWGGFVGGLGVSTFYATSAGTLVPQLRSYFSGMAGLFPTDVGISVLSEGDEIESTTGELTGGWSTASVAVVGGSASGGYSAVSGGLAKWGTATVLSGRRLKGHTYLVPLSSSQYGTDGSLTSVCAAAIASAGASLVAAAAGNMLLYQRPRIAAAAWTDQRGHVHPAVVARGGGYGPVTTGTSRAKVTELRSRRD
jgi:hypothetical protein